MHRNAPLLRNLTTKLLTALLLRNRRKVLLHVLVNVRRLPPNNGYAGSVLQMKQEKLLPHRSHGVFLVSMPILQVAPMVKQLLQWFLNN